MIRLSKYLNIVIVEIRKNMLSNNKIVNFNQYKKQLSTSSVIEVADFDQFTQALINPNVNKMVFVNDVTSLTGQTALNENLFTGELSANTLNIFSDQYKNIARKLEIDLNGYDLNLDNNYISFSDRNYGKNFWDILVKNGRLFSNSEMNSAPFYFNKVSEENQQKTKFNFEDILVELNGPAAFTGVYSNVAIAGNTFFKIALDKSGIDKVNTSYSNGFAVGNLMIKENANVRLNVDTPNYMISTSEATHMERNNNMIWLQSSGLDKYAKMLIGANASVVMESKTVDMRGIVSRNPKSVVKLGKKAKLQMKLAQGHSLAIAAGDLLLAQGAKVEIITGQDNNSKNLVNNVLNVNDYHYAPISIGMEEQAGNRHHTLKLAQDASLKIIRSQVNTITPLISFGLGKNNPSQSYVLKLAKNSSLELCDESIMENYLVTDKQVNSSGLITMYGHHSKNQIIFDEPRYINLQRNGAFGGNLLKLEGAENSIKLNGGSIDKMPASHYRITQTMNNGRQNKWDVAHLTTIDRLSSSILVSPTKAGRGSFSYADKSINTNAPYKTGGNYLAETDTLNEILKYFNWQTPSRLTFTSYALENSKYIPQAEGMIIFYNSALPNNAQTTSKITFLDKANNKVKAPILKKELGEAFLLGEDAPANAQINSETGAITIVPTAAEVGKTLMIPVIIRFRDYSQLEVIVPIEVISSDDREVRQLNQKEKKNHGMIKFPVYVIKVDDKDSRKVA